MNERNHEMHPETAKDGRKKVSITADTTVTATTDADQTLENIKMAYYWAGYYSGLYDGQRQGQTQKQ